MSSWEASVAVTATVVQAGLPGVRISLGARDFSLLERIKTGLGPGGKAVGA